MRSYKVAAAIAFCGGVALATLESVHLRAFLWEWLPRPIADWLPVATIGAFTLALYLSHAKHPQVMLDGTFAPTGAPDHHLSGLFVSNVGDSTAVNILVESIGVQPFDVSFDPVSFVNPGGDRKAVTLRYGPDVRDIFGVGAFLSFRNVSRGPGQTAESLSHSMRFTYETVHGRTFINDDYELGFIVGVSGAPIGNRYVIRKRPKVKRTLRDRLGALLVRLAARVLQRPPNVE
jgi:hypothetical protein